MNTKEFETLLFNLFLKCNMNKTRMTAIKKSMIIGKFCHVKNVSKI